MRLFPKLLSKSVTAVSALNNLLIDSIPTRSGYSIESFIAVTIHEHGLPFQQAFRSAVSCTHATTLPTYILSSRATRLLSGNPQSNGRSKKSIQPCHLNLALFELFPEADTILYFSSAIRFTGELCCQTFQRTNDLIYAKSEPLRQELADLIFFGIPFTNFVPASLFIASRSSHATLFSKALSLLTSEDFSSVSSSILLSNVCFETTASMKCLGTLPQYPIDPRGGNLEGEFPAVELVKISKRWGLRTIEEKLHRLPNLSPRTLGRLDKTHYARRVV